MFDFEWSRVGALTGAFSGSDEREKGRAIRLAAVRLGMMADARAVIIIWSRTWSGVGWIRSEGGSFGEAVRRRHRRKSSLVMLN
jgi:hypothetical protein